jgi:hypothetical protein
MSKVGSPLWASSICSALPACLKRHPQKVRREVVPHRDAKSDAGRSGAAGLRSRGSHALEGTLQPRRELHVLGVGTPTSAGNGATRRGSAHRRRAPALSQGMGLQRDRDHVLPIDQRLGGVVQVLPAVLPFDASSAAPDPPLGDARVRTRATSTALSRSAGSDDGACAKR